MQQQSGSFQNEDGLKIHTIQWLPDHAPKAIILIVHGLAEHSGRYQHVAQLLVEHGYAVYSLDHRSHGRSEGQPRTHFDDFEHPLHDLDHYFATIREKHPTGKFFVYGHSMGAFIALTFTLRHQEQLTGLVISGSPVTVDTTVSPILITLADILQRIAPKLPLVKFDLQSISRDPAVVAAYNADPLIKQTPARVGMAYTYNQLLKQLRANLDKFYLPLLILHGGEDKITPVSGSEMVYQQVSSEDKTLKLYPGLYHEIHNEPEKDRVLNDILTWLNAH